MDLPTTAKTKLKYFYLRQKPKLTRLWQFEVTT